MSALPYLAAMPNPDAPSSRPSTRTSRVGRALAVVAVASGIALVGPASPASAAGLCGDSYHVVATRNIKSGGAVVGLLTVQRNGNHYCGVTRREGSYKGHRGYTAVDIYHVYSDGISSSRLAGDRGAYSYYAGPVKSPNTSCVQVVGQVSLRQTHTGYEPTASWTNCPNVGTVPG